MQSPGRDVGEPQGWVPHPRGLGVTGGSDKTCVESAAGPGELLGLAPGKEDSGLHLLLSTPSGASQGQTQWERRGPGSLLVPARQGCIPGLRAGEGGVAGAANLPTVEAWRGLFRALAHLQALGGRPHSQVRGTGSLFY